MSNTVEDQIVAMHFDNKQFESGVAQSLGSLDKLKSSLQFQNAGRGLEDINRSVGRFSMQPMADAVDGISKKWIALTTIAVTAISNITNKVVDSALRMGKSLIVDPFTQGFQEYGTNLSSIQTIIANTGAKLPAVNATLQQLNKYSDLTIYNFSQMAQSIGRFTAAGVAMGPATAAIKGMANTAALSGATSEQLNSAMYQMSQALSTGVIRLMDWNSLANANMGGTNIQKALQETAKAGEDQGAAMQAAIEKTGSFRDSLTEGWLTGDIFTKTMKVMAGQLDKTTGKYTAFTVEQLKGMGYSEEAAKELNRLSQASIDSATQVKTIGQAYDVIKESIGSGWAKVFQNIFGNFEKSKKLWTGVTTFITDGIGSFFGKINHVLNDWNKLGGRFQLLQGIKQAFKDLLRLFVPIKNAFKEVFPPATGKALTAFSRGFHDFFELFRLNVKTMHAIREVFVAIFSAIKFVFTLIGKGIGLIKLFFGLFSSGAGSSFVDFFTKGAKAVSDFFKKAEKSTTLYLIFRRLQSMVIALVKALRPLGDVFSHIADTAKNLASQGKAVADNFIGGILEGFSGSVGYQLQNAIVDLANNMVQWIKDALGIHSPAEALVPIGVNVVLGIVDGIESAGPKLLEGLRNVFEVMATGLGLFVEGLGRAFADAMENMDLDSFLNIINTLLTGGFLLAAIKVANAFKGIASSAGGVLNQITDNLKTMQSDIKADIIRKIAISVALLAGAAYLLSKLDAKQLGYSMAAIAGLMSALTVSMRVLLKGDSGMSIKDVSKKSLAMSGLGVAMVAFATAIVILAGAVAILGKLKPEELVQGLKAVGLVVGGIVAATAILSKTGGGATILATAAALLILSAALVAFAGTLKFYANLDWGMIIDGGGKAAAVIIGIGLAMRAFGKFALRGSVGLLIASAGLLVLANALEKISGINAEALSNSLVAIVVTLGAVGLAGKVLASGGALGLLAGAAAIFVIAAALKLLSAIPADKLTKAFVFITLGFTALVIAAGALAPLTPVMLAFGAAALLVGQGIALAGLGILAFAFALGIIAVVGPAAFQAIGDGVTLLVDVLGNSLGTFALAAAAFVALGAGAIIGGAGLVILAAAVVIFSAAIIVLAAAIVIGAAALALLAGSIALLRGQSSGAIDDIIGAFKRLTNVKETLTNIKNAVGDWFAGLKEKFNNGLTTVKAAISGIIQGVKDKLFGWMDDMLNWGKDIGGNLLDGVVNGIEDAWHWVQEKLEWVADHIPGWIRDRLGIESPSKVMRDDVGQWIAKGLADGISKHANSAERASEDLANKSLDAMRFAFNKSRAMGDSLEGIKPKITPVLDLSQLARDASEISGALSGRHTINAGVSGRRAQDISANESRRRGIEAASINETYNFNQTILSPKPANRVEIYRSTKSQIALFKEVKGQ